MVLVGAHHFASQKAEFQPAMGNRLVVCELYNPIQIHFDFCV